MKNKKGTQKLHALNIADVSGGKASPGRSSGRTSVQSRRGMRGLLPFALGSFLIGILVGAAAALFYPKLRDSSVTKDVGASLTKFGTKVADAVGASVSAVVGKKDDAGTNNSAHHTAGRAPPVS